MEIVDVSFAVGRRLRVCDFVDDERAASAAEELGAMTAALRRETRAAAALAARVMVGGWAPQPQPVHVEAMAGQR